MSLSQLNFCAIRAQCLVVAVVVLAAAGAASAADNEAGGPRAVIRLDLDETAGVMKLGDGSKVTSGQLAVMQIGDPADFVGMGEETTDPVTCLAQAIYYEARSESLAGQQAVAQVVINRTRSGLFPSSICGVVYQRTHAYSGCQFSFVCDGSMDRAADSQAWAIAEGVAKQAVAGFVYAPLKDAMHYHADWMTPYWAASLPRIRQIGRHIFYR